MTGGWSCSRWSLISLAIDACPAALRPAEHLQARSAFSHSNCCRQCCAGKASCAEKKSCRLVDPDRWLQVNDGLHLVRLVRHDGSVRVDLKSYYVGRALAGRHVALHVSAAKRALLVVHERRVIKTLPLKGLTGKTVRFEAFVQLMKGQARSERRLRNAQERRVRLGASGSP